MNVSQALREPLLHFLAIGAGLFLLYGAVAPAESSGERIVVTKAKVADLARQYQAAWNRAPTPKELQTLIDAEVRSEILYREGRSLGLADDDAVIKRRVRQKFELMSEEENAGLPPDDAALAAYLASHADKFRRPPVVSFDQILIEMKGSDDAIDARLAAARRAVLAGAELATLGDATMLPHQVNATPLDLVARDFGEKFAAAVGKAPLGDWGPPVLSGYGIHLVKVTERTAAALPPLADIRAEVAREWENDRRTKASEASYARLLQRYDVLIEGKP